MSLLSKVWVHLCARIFYMHLHILSSCRGWCLLAQQSGGFSMCFSLRHQPFFTTATFYLDQTDTGWRQETCWVIEPAFQLWDWYAKYSLRSSTGDGGLLGGRLYPWRSCLIIQSLQNILKKHLTSAPIDSSFTSRDAFVWPLSVAIPSILPHLHEILRNWYEILSMIAKVLFGHQTGIWMCLGLMTKTVAWDEYWRELSKNLQFCCSEEKMRSPTFESTLHLSTCASKFCT